jgi:hypothetical protein
MVFKGVSLNDKLQAIANNPTKSLVLLAVLSLSYFIGIGQVHLFDWDEINFAESAREMIESGDYLRVQINYLPFWEKPPFFFWLQVLSMKLFGINEFAARFPNALMGFVYMATLYYIGKKHLSGSFGLLWALVFSASLLPHVYFKSGIIDPVFNYFIFLSVYFMARALLSASTDRSTYYYALLSGVFSGLSVITKGPVGFLLLGLTLFVYLIITRFKNFPSIKKIAFFLVGITAIVAVWLGLEVAQNGFAVLNQFIEYQLALFNKPVAGHDQPFYYHFVVVFFGCFPASILALPILFGRQNDVTGIALVKWSQVLFWTVLVLFSIATTKIIHYSSMTYIPLSFLAAYQLHQFGLRTFQRYLLIVLGVLISIIFFSIPFLFYKKDLLLSLLNDEFAIRALRDGPNFSFIHVVYSVVFLAFILLALNMLKKKKFLSFGLFTFLGTGLTLAAVMTFLLPTIEETTQGPSIVFSKNVAQKDCYYDAIGFKSYVPYFYGRVPYKRNEKATDLNWLIDGDIDKPVYFLGKYDYLFLETRPAFVKVEEKGGFILWRRLPQ